MAENNKGRRLRRTELDLLASELVSRYENRESIRQLAVFVGW